MFQVVVEVCDGAAVVALLMVASSYFHQYLADKRSFSDRG
jgi:hypothetical protein